MSHAENEIKKGRRKTKEGIKLPIKENQRMLEEKENCKYMGILEAGTIRRK